MTLSEASKRMPASAAPSIVVSLYESPVAIVLKLSRRNALTHLRFGSCSRMWKSVIFCVAGSTSSLWQKSVGSPSFFMKGIPNS